MDCSKPLVVVIGSSVASGCYAPFLKGWSWMLGEHLQSQGFAYRNLAMPGSNTSDTIRQYRLAVAHLKPRIVIIGLSIANEGLDVEGFLSNMKLLISEIKKNGSACMIGSVYPNNLYEKEEYELLLMTHQEMKKWKQEENLIDAFFDFMTLDDGNGHWKKGTYADPSHPNHEGHKMMFEAIDLSVFPKFLSS